ncbi:MAG TPA: plastocyanin/azurin family copper-binding protein [Egibacteraceae bacterium]|nr:plastocyanin/azurin family copper-binding protein [Egibacteraceae bacterium]
MSRKLLPVIFAVVGALALAGCSKQEPEFTAQDQVAAVDRTEGAEDGGDSGEQAPTVTFVAEQIQFVEAPSEVPAGTVAFVLDNQSALPHDVTLEGSGLVVLAAPGASERGSVTLTAGEEYTYFCSVPGHRATMEGTFTVVE